MIKKLLVITLFFLTGCSHEGHDHTSSKVFKDDQYLTHLGLVKGHLHVGVELYKKEYYENAKRHMKHPKSELYAGLIPTFEAKKTNGFATELEALALSVENNEELSIVSKNYNILLEAIRQNENYVKSESNSFKNKVLLVRSLLEIAAEEYAIGIVDGNIQNKFEYQDALGFTTVAKSILNEASSLSEAEDVKRNKMIKIIDSLSSLWPSLVPTEKISGDAVEILTAVDKINSL
ncbi:hypothetical protein N9S84_00860 [Nitrosomonadales bacterium]|nr:hypothetical protein [Nitrosomonadales bacterium]